MSSSKHKSPETQSAVPVVKPTLRKIALVGMPNSGKSQVFSQLTGHYSPVANYAQTTIEFIRGKVRTGAEDFELIDTPGLHCLFVHSEEETKVRKMFMEEKPDILIQCIDANRLKQSLVLTADLLELGIPMLISLNAIDETTRSGVWIDAEELSKALNLPVVESVAIRNIGMKELLAAIAQARAGKFKFRYADMIEGIIQTLSSHIPDSLPARKLSSLLLEEDTQVLPYLKSKLEPAAIKNLEHDLAEAKSQFRGRFSMTMNKSKNQWIDELFSVVAKKRKTFLPDYARTVSAWCRHPILGLPILLMVLGIIYVLVVNVANVLADWMTNFLWTPIENEIISRVPEGIYREFLVGDYGILSMGVANTFITVLPILSLFFLAFNALEDVGYIPNLCVLLRRVFQKFGLSGNALMPLVLGFGCKTMATMSARGLRSRKEQIIATYLVASAIPCAAQMGLVLNILGGVGFQALLIVFSVLLVSEVIAGLTLNRFVKEELSYNYIQELPPIRLPNPRNVLRKTYFRLMEFLQEALPIFIGAAFFMFVAHHLGILDVIKSIIHPVLFGLLGLPSEMADAMILCLARQEAAMAVVIKLMKDGILRPEQATVAVLAIFIPCSSNIVAITKSFGLKIMMFMGVAILINAFFWAAIVNWAQSLF